MLCVSVALWLSACESHHNRDAIPEVRLAMFQGAVAPHLAQALGLFEQEGLRVVLQEMPGGAKSMEALLGGSADVMAGTYEQAIQMAAEGREIQSFLIMNRYHGLILVVSPATRRSIRRIEDLKGAVLGVPGLGGSSQFFVNYLLLQHGLSPQDITAVGIGTGATSLVALERGQADAGIVMGGAFTTLKKRYPDLTILADTYSAQGTRQTFGVDSYPSMTLLAEAAWLQQNGPAAHKLARALQRTSQWMREHSPEEIRAKMPVQYRMEDAAADLEAIRLLIPMLSPDGKMSPESAEAVRKVLSVSLEKVRTAQIDLAKTYTNEFANSLQSDPAKVTSSRR